MREQLVRLLWFMRFFSGTLCSSETDRLGELLTATLLDPVLLDHQANRIANGMASNEHQHSAGELQRRPLTPGPMYSRRLLPPLEKKGGKIREIQPLTLTSGIASVDFPLVNQPALKPMAVKKEQQRHIMTVKTKRRPTWRYGIPVPSISLEDFYEEIEAAILQLNVEACSYLLKRPEMKKLSVDALKDLFKEAFKIAKKNENSNIAREMFSIVLRHLMTKIVPFTHPDSFGDFFHLVVHMSVPRKLFTMSCKYINLISSGQLSKIVEDMELDYVWERLETYGAVNIGRFSFMIMEIAGNLERSEDLLKLDYVSKVVAIQRDESYGKAFAATLGRVQFIYMSSYLLSALKHMDPNDETVNFEESITNMFTVSKTELILSTEEVLKHLEAVMKVFLVRMRDDQAELLSQFMKILHRKMLEQNDIAFVPKRMEGAEDLYLYVKDNLISLARARLKHYRASRLTKSQVLALLNMADLNQSYDSEMSFAILATVQLSPASVTALDYQGLSMKAGIILKIMFTFPRRFEGNLCVDNPDLKHSQTINWPLPPDLFIPKTLLEHPIVDELTNALLNIPRLFLYRVFGLPLTDFAEVCPGMNELPETQELIDTANFFLERWCATSKQSGAYPIVKVIN